MLLTFRSRAFLNQPINNAHRLHRHARDFANQIHDVARIAHLISPIIWVINNAGSLIFLTW